MKELSDINSCLNRAASDEMVFVLLERDEAAASTIRHWIGERLRLGKNKPNDAQMIEAAACANYIEHQHKKNDEGI